MNQINNFYTSSNQLITLSQDVSTVADGVTMVPLDDLSVTIKAGQTAKIEGLLIYKTGNNEGVKIAINATEELAYNFVKFNDSSDVQSFSLAGVFGIPHPATWADKSNDGKKNKAVRFVATVKGGAENSTVQLSFSQWQVGNVATTIKAGSCLLLIEG